MRTANAQTLDEQEVDMDRRLTILETEFTHIKGTLNELRGKLDAANEAIFALREDFLRTTGELRTEMKTGFGELRTEMATTTGELRQEMTAGFGELRAAIEASEGRQRAALEKAIGELKATIEKQSGRHRTENWKTRVWFLTIVIGILGGALYFVARAMKWI
jgi:chromosome segregation ATPase